MTDRTAHPRILPMIVDRWSPRAFDGTPLPDADMAVLLEAAALAPSAHNQQPWRFLYALNGDAHWATFLDLLVPFNAGWARNAGALAFVLSDTLMERPGAEPAANHSHSFDAGAAWATLALQAMTMGYHTHGMTGVDFERARDVLQVPATFRIEAAIAIGRKAAPDSLPEPLRAREAPSGRHPVARFAAAGTFAALPG